MSTKGDPLANVLEAHQAAQAAQNEMRDAAAVRNRTVRAALDSGYTTADIARHIGVSQRRVQAMAKDAAGYISTWPTES